MKILRIEGVEIGDVCAAYDRFSVESKYYVRLSSKGRWLSMADEHKSYEFLGPDGVRYWFYGDLRVTVVE